MKAPIYLLLLASFAITSCTINPPPPPEHPPVRKVTVTGASTINVAPDQMYWTVQVSFNGSTLAAAKASHDASLSSALNYVKSLGDAIKDMQTGGIRFDKKTDFQPKEDRSRPYTCSTQVTFTLTDFDKYAGICDALAKLDGVEVQSIEYAYSKQEQVRLDAYKQALVKAHDTAAELATTANCALGAPIDINENAGYMPYSSMDNSTAAAPAAGTPAAVAGQIAIMGTVTATYDLIPK